MATVPVRSQPLHNFSLPSFLKWGKNQMNNQRCRKPVDSSQESPSLDHRSSASEAESDGGSLGERESELENRKNPMMIASSRSLKNRLPSSSSSSYYYCSSDIPQPLKKNNLSPAVLESETGVEEGKSSNSLVRVRTGCKDEQTVVEKKNKTSSVDVLDAGVTGEREVEESATKPWNLRPRRVVFKSPIEIEGTQRNNGEFQEKTENLPKSLRLRGFAAEGQNVEKKEKRKFWISLSREEIEEDFFIMTGSKPSRRPKKRAKNIQKQLDNVFPGLWLAGITADSYIVPDVPAKR